MLEVTKARIDPSRVLLTAAGVTVITVATIVALCHINKPTTSSDAQAYATVAGVCAAAAYFVVRFFTGEFWVGVAIEVSTERSAAGRDGGAWFSIVVKVTNARSGAVVLCDAGAILTEYGGEPRPVEMGAGYHRYAARGYALDLESPAPSKDMKHLIINPGDAVQLVGVTRVSAEKPVTVDVVLSGRAQIGMTRNQWVSSTVSLPASTGMEQHDGAAMAQSAVHE